MKKTYIIRDRNFEISVDHFCASLYIVGISEVKHPERKFFKGKTLKDNMVRCIDDFETVDDMVLDALNEKFAFEVEIKVKNEKLENFEKTLDEPYIL